MQIRKAEMEDIERILAIYERAREYMAESGNAKQWDGGYPGRKLVEEDICSQSLFVCESGDGMEGVFALKEGEDPTYQAIEDGHWLNGNDYVTIHRLASAGRKKGVFQFCLCWMRERYDNIRADTHEDNRTMRHLLEKNGFIRCGIIYVRDGSPRVAFQLAKGR